MDTVKKLLGAGILIALVVSGVMTFMKKSKEQAVITYSTSDAKNLKGEISIALDSWIGYFPFRSAVFGRLMRDAGYRIKVIDDRADYPARMEQLRKGKINFAVCTVDSYLINGQAVKYPGVIVSLIDESKGGDAIVAWKDRIPNIDSLKKSDSYRIAFTPASPSEHLLKSIAVHFDIPLLKNKKGDWRMETTGSTDALKAFTAQKADAAVLWEPDVTEALSKKGTVKLMGSEDMKNLIVDILLVNRRFAEAHSEETALFVKNYHTTLNIYSASTDRLHRDITENMKLSKKQVTSMLKGVRWINLAENITWFGLNRASSPAQPEIVKSILSTIRILTDNNDFTANPLPDQDPYTIINSSFIKALHSPGHAVAKDASQKKYFIPLADDAWRNMHVVGSLKIRPITFRSGTAEVDDNGRGQIKEIAESLSHYPNFRILVKGHSGLLGDPIENKKLSAARAGAVKKELHQICEINPNRLKVAGAGADEPLARESGESDRAYNNRLKRVEVYFLTDGY